MEEDDGKGLMSELTDFVCGFPDVERALVLAPHPDDETLGCGGTIALYSGRIDFTIVAVSNGEAVNIPEENKSSLRKKEFQKAAGTLGAKTLIFLDIPDGNFSDHRNSLRGKLSDLFAAQRPQLVFVPSPIDPHPDHRETALACMELALSYPALRVAFYEIYNPTRFNVLIDIGPVIETKKQALLHYHYSMLKQEEIFIASNLGLNKSRSVFTLRDSYYEAFWMPSSTPGPEDVVRWFTSDLQVSTPEDRLLDNLRVADALVHEVRMLEAKGAEKEKIAEQLAADLREKEEVIASLRGHVLLMESGLLHRSARRYYLLRDTLLPEGTSRRRLYNRVAGLFRGRTA
jgi:LmbE family N-acetylglucosaminyl deacetylase